VVGAQWGDEGKGKIVDWLSNRADMVVRFQGGHNAGHTLVVDGKVYKLALLPSGVVQGKPSIIGNGVVVDPWHLVGEIEKIQAQGVAITPDILTIADNACLILPIHPALDVAREAAASTPGAKIGTTGRGIGPAYEDKVGRRAIRVCDLANEDDLKIKIDRLRSHHDPLRAGNCWRSRRRSCPTSSRRGGCWTPRRRRASACCSKGPRAPSWTWITAPIPM